MLSKAKTLTGEWVTGSHVQVNEKHYILDSCGYDRVKKRPFYGHEINSLTLCQQVRGTEFFEGDEVEAVINNQQHVIGFITYNEDSFRWEVEVLGDILRWSLKDWKPTGKNIYDDE
jgi:hypothetical protein